MSHPRYAPVGEYAPFHLIATATTKEIGALVNTASVTTITAGNNVIVTPTTMANIFAGMRLNIANGTGTAEDILVKSITGTTFTADFLNSHSGAYTVISLKGSYLGKVIVNAPGTSAILTLYNGHPSTLPVAGAAFAIVPLALGAPAGFDCWCNRGLFYTLSGTPGDYTLTYLDSGV